MLADTAERASPGALHFAKPILFILALVAVALPVMWPENLLLVDNPNHLARFHIAKAISSDSWLAGIYEIKTGFFPYYGMSLVMRALTGMMGVEAAGRLFAGIAVLMPTFGTILLSRVIHGRILWVPLAAVALSMNALVGWGFLNFVFSIGIVLAAFAAWVALDRFSLALKTAIFVPLIFLTGCVHLLSAGILFGLIGAWELAGATEEESLSRAVRRAVRHLPALAVLGAIVGLLFAIAPEEGIGGSRSAWGGIAYRTEVFSAPFAMGRSRLETLLGFAVLIPAYMAWREGLFRLAPRFGRMLLLTAPAALAAPAMMFGVYALHIRLPLLLVLIFLAALSPRPGAFGGRLPKTLVTCFVAVTGLHLAVVGKTLSADSRGIAELREAAHIIPRGARVLPALDLEAALRTGPAQSLFHVSSFLVIDRSVFLPTLFGMYELGVRPEYRDLFPLQASPTEYADLFTPGSKKLQTWERPEAYDYVVALAPDPEKGRPPGMNLAHAGSWFEILQVVK